MLDLCHLLFIYVDVENELLENTLRFETNVVLNICAQPISLAWTRQRCRKCIANFIQV